MYLMFCILYSLRAEIKQAPPTEKSLYLLAAASLANSILSVNAYSVVNPDASLVMITIYMIGSVPLTVLIPVLLNYIAGYFSAAVAKALCILTIVNTFVMYLNVRLVSWDCNSDYLAEDASVEQQLANELWFSVQFYIFIKVAGYALVVYQNVGKNKNVLATQYPPLRSDPGWGGNERGTLNANRERSVSSSQPLLDTVGFVDENDFPLRAP